MFGLVVLLLGTLPVVARAADNLLLSNIELFELYQDSKSSSVLHTYISCKLQPVDSTFSSHQAVPSTPYLTNTQLPSSTKMTMEVLHCRPPVPTIGNFKHPPAAAQNRSKFATTRHTAGASMITSTIPPFRSISSTSMLKCCSPLYCPSLFGFEPKCDLLA